MKKTLFSLVTVMLILTSCGADAVKFNDTIVNEQEALEVTLTEYGTKLGQAIETNAVADIKPLGDSLLTKIDKSIDVIKALNTPSGGEKFKETAIIYFEFTKQIVKLGDKAASIGNEPTEEQATAFSNEYNDIAKVIAEKGEAFRNIQKEFAKEKNMRLQ
ncbi:MAG: hypothetical protein LBL79_12945 [Prevotella sp.]|jgi:hypothetical protein|nr:hypothetical protein [Prevotella sp.]